MPSVTYFETSQFLSLRLASKSLTRMCEGALGLVYLRPSTLGSSVHFKECTINRSISVEALAIGPGSGQVPKFLFHLDSLEIIATSGTPYIGLCTTKAQAKRSGDHCWLCATGPVTVWDRPFVPGTEEPDSGPPDVRYLPFLLQTSCQLVRLSGLSWPFIAEWRRGAIRDLQCLGTPVWD